MLLNWSRGRESLLLLTGLKGVVDSKDEVKTSSLQNILRPEVESDISRSCLIFQETEKSGAIYYIPQGGPHRPLIYCCCQNLFVQDIQSGDTPLGQLMWVEIDF